MLPELPPYLKDQQSVYALPKQLKYARLSFMDKTLLRTAQLVKSVFLQAELAADTSPVHKIHPAVKSISLLYLAVVISLVNNPTAQLLISGALFLLVLLGGLRILAFYRKIFLLAFVFGFLVVFPASLNLITPGEPVIELISLTRSYQLWIYHIPRQIVITKEGLYIVSLIFLRVFNSTSLALLIIFTTPFPAFIKSFKMMGVPDAFLMVVSLAYKFIFLLSRTMEESYLAMRSRMLGNIRNEKIRKLISGRVFFIFKRSAANYEATYQAMVSRGYNGSIKSDRLPRFVAKDYLSLCGVIAFGIILILI